ncbi:hypothetical protein ARMGADRAFT_732339 [Armillaria gallica]|uniref:Uncharacterized protein n=1 Tax=Armillaria gallica TaxID=47427 RepID=A0A2H3CKY0_ARMGA|nr:hypothetical protein ARMGADRAFT_732339 [Armillaria gallica]
MSDSQIDDFASIQVLMMEYSESCLNGVIIHSMTHGIYTALLAIVLWRTLSSRRSTTRGGQTKVLVGISVFMYIMAMMHLTVRLINSSSVFIKNGGSNETKSPSATYHLSTDGPLWVQTISSIAVGINIFIADCVIIWRCWIIWGRNWKIVVLPCICTLCGMIFAALCLNQFLTLSTDSQGNPFRKNSVNWRIPYYIMALPTTIICTMLIVYRLARALTSTTEISLRLGSNLYYKVIEILVESSTLYVVALVVNIPFITMNDPYGAYPQAVLDSVTGMAPTLILLRVLSWTRGSSDNEVHSGPLQPPSESRMEAGVPPEDDDSGDD